MMLLTNYALQGAGAWKEMHQAVEICSYISVKDSSNSVSCFQVLSILYFNPISQCFPSYFLTTPSQLAKECRKMLNYYKFYYKMLTNNKSMLDYFSMFSDTSICKTYYILSFCSILDSNLKMYLVSHHLKF